MKLQMTRYIVSSLKIKERNCKRDMNRAHFSLNVSNIRINDESFNIIFKCAIKNSDIAINTEIRFIFCIKDGIVNDEFMKGNFININAPAIAFPYLRAYITNISIQSGYNPIILPSINFVEFNKKKVE